MVICHQVEYIFFLFFLLFSLINGNMLQITFTIILIWFQLNRDRELATYKCIMISTQIKQNMS